MPIEIRELPYLSEDTDVIRHAIRRDLQKEGIYRKDLMYRGAAVSQTQIENIKKYGTDRSNKEKVAKMQEKDHIDDLRAIRFMRDDTHDDQITIDEYISLRNIEADYEYSSEHIWALPEDGLESCINTYTQLSNGIPVLFVYNPECLEVFYYDEGKAGPRVDTIFDKIDPRDESNAFYKFVDGITPLNALIAVYQLTRRNTNDKRNGVRVRKS